MEKCGTEEVYSYYSLPNTFIMIKWSTF